MTSSYQDMVAFCMYSHICKKFLYDIGFHGTFTGFPVGVLHEGNEKRLFFGCLDCLAVCP